MALSSIGRTVPSPTVLRASLEMEDALVVKEVTDDNGVPSPILTRHWKSVTQSYSLACLDCPCVA